MKTMRDRIPFLSPVVVIGVGAVFGVLFDYLFWDHHIGLGFTVWNVLLVGAMMFAGWYARGTLSRSSLVLAGLALVFASMVAIRASVPLTVLNVFTVLYLEFLLAHALIGERLGRYVVLDYIRAALAPFEFLPPYFRTLRAPLTERKKATEAEKRSLGIVRGVLISAPVAGLLVLLFASADLIFRDAITSVLDISLSPSTVVRMGLIAFIGSVVIGAIGFVLSVKARGPRKLTEKHVPRITEAAILFATINVVFLSFLLVQLRYLFGGEETIVEQGFTYAEYARKGFAELIVATVFTFAVMWVVDYTFEVSKRRQRLLQWLFGAVVVQEFVLLASAHTRLSLYEEAYGFTNARFYAHVIIALVGLLLLSFAYKLFVKASESEFLLRAGAIGVLSLLVINLINPESFIIEQNIAGPRPLDDFYHSYQLSTDALGPIQAQALSASNSYDSEHAYTLLANHANRIRYWNTSSWSSINYSRIRAQRFFEDHADEIQNADESSIYNYNHTSPYLPEGEFVDEFADFEPSEEVQNNPPQGLVSCNDGLSVCPAPVE